ncbi:hypothetical protein GCM10010347_41680 [Streptomyces cirratus]|uniref:Uncharacterized protein n=2 Tax=Streptomyces cirratus TaxID=68187 RepID=A0ABQ3F0P0_9ACTN|nr:hypothetical protein GCM10010347_41680 [Streptomyces cirratus]
MSRQRPALRTSWFHWDNQDGTEGSRVVRARRIGTILSAAALTMLTIPMDAHAAAIACGGGVSTGRVAVNGCISAERGKEGKVITREITAHVKLRNSGPTAVDVSYEAFFRVVSGGHWVKLGSGRTYVPAQETVGPTEVGSSTRPCAPLKVEIRVHARVAGGVWSGWSTAGTAQCQT